MKQTILFAALGVVAFGASAQEIGHVLSRQPVVQQVAVPHQVCNNQLVQAPTTGGGSVLGMLTGAGIGSAIGAGGGNAAAIVGGAVLGAVVGNNIEARNNTMVVPNCVTQNTIEDRTVAWNVTYEYAGRQYQVQMPYDPGATVRLNIGPVGTAQGSSTALATQDGAAVTAPPLQAPMEVQAQPQVQPAQVLPAQVQAVQGQPQVITQQPQVITQQPIAVAAAPAVVYAAPAPVYAYPYPYYRPYPYPVSLSFGFGYWGGHGWHH